MKKVFFAAFLPLLFLGISALTEEVEMAQEQTPPPRYLYKILSVENWDKSRGKPEIALPSEDREFIHLAREDQLDRIIQKFWGGTPSFVVLKLETSRLKGKLVLESNPGGTTLFYHLYQGAIPRDAVVEFKVISK